MAPKNLKDKAISIKGKQYVLVSDRVIYFNDTYSSGSILTEMLSGIGDQVVIFKATVIPDVTIPDRKFTAYSQAKWGDGMVNKTSALENAETSAVGRALGMMGIGVLDSIASADEINKAFTATPRTFTPQGQKVHNTAVERKIEKQERVDDAENEINNYPAEWDE